ncbi:MAG: PAS domain S-box protein, partial [Actinomycetia bacterium]|nr:PAS domain S-box protein [Actinomycetes bacterium]
FDGFRVVGFVPLYTKHQIIGVIILASKTKSNLNEDEKYLLKSISSNLALIVENVNLYNETIKAARSIQNIQQYYQSFLEDIPMGICLINNKGRVLIFNEAASEICKVTSEKIKNKDLINLKKLKNPFLKVLLPVVRFSQKTRKATIRGEVIVPHNKKESIIGYTASRLMRGSKQTIGAALVFQDLTNIKTMEKQLFEKQRLALLGQLIAQVAHDIRNPLNVIQMFTELMEPEISDDLKSNTEIILEQIKLCNRRIKKLLSFSRTPSAYDPSEISSINKILNESLNQALATNEKEIKIEKKFEQKDLYVQGSSDGLMRLFINLIDNAFSAMDNGGKLTLELKKSSNKEAVIKIKDSGIGMDREMKKKIFEPFFTTKKEGTGLGLAIVQSIIFDFGGSIEVSSTLGKGSTFFIRLPIRSKLPKGEVLFKKEKKKEKEIVN